MTRAALLLATTAVLAAAPVALGRDRPAGPTVYVVDNAFVRGGLQRPVLAIRPGTAVTWAWSSRQSHSVSVRSGPETFAIPARNRGRFRHRFTRSGTYRIECELHAPGMKMTVRVRR